MTIATPKNKQIFSFGPLDGAWRSLSDGLGRQRKGCNIFAYKT